MDNKIKKKSNLLKVTSFKKKHNKPKRIDPKILKTLPIEIQKDNSLLKYWNNRFRLFKKYDLGIKLDKGNTNFS